MLSVMPNPLVTDTVVWSKILSVCKLMNMRFYNEPRLRTRCGGKQRKEVQYEWVL